MDLIRLRLCKIKRVIKRVIMSVIKRVISGVMKVVIYQDSDETQKTIFQ